MNRFLPEDHIYIFMYSLIARIYLFLSALFLKDYTGIMPTCMTPCHEHGRYLKPFNMEIQNFFANIPNCWILQFEYIFILVLKHTTEWNVGEHLRMLWR